ncbi:CoB--CoM heterodisulfide reductase iron-sulfur subunit A family protein [bacterium]|nr:MAG: CoB--CoM heterodisulfide reductase iron-sulfur subunit A family protein [bacterium]
MNKDILVIGGGIAGIQASLLIAESGRKVYLAEKTSMIGGNAIKFEEVFPNMECSTCMLAPKQQELLQNANIELLTLATLKRLDGSPGDFTATIQVKAGYVSPVDCIGCGACYEPCPVSVKNPFEENLNERKAIFVPCAGALPNVPVIDTDNCVRFTKGEDCTACQEACMFEAIDFNQEDKELQLKVGAVVVATGFDEFDVKDLPEYGYGELDCVYTAMEFERLFASNGPTLGELTLRNGETPKKAAIVHCVGRDKVGYCSGICCMYSAKFARFLKHKIDGAEVFALYSDLCVPGKLNERFYRETLGEGVSYIHCGNVKVEKNSKGAKVTYDSAGKSESIDVDMVILAPAVIANPDNVALAEILGIECDSRGFFATETGSLAPVTTSREGIYVAGCAESPKDIAASITQAGAAVNKIISTAERASVPQAVED